MELIHTFIIDEESRKVEKFIYIIYGKEFKNR
jgi:hypothetical protein